MEEDYDHDAAGDPAQAFDALRAEVAALRQAIEAHPTVRMTPDQSGQAMTRTGRDLMNEVAQKYDRARQDAERERRHLAEMIGTLQGKQEQRLLLIGIPVVVFLFTPLMAPFLFSALPFGLNEWVGSIVMGDR